MSFEEEWAGLTANAAARMQLNGAPTTDPRLAPSDGDLVIYDDELGKIGHFAYQLHNNLKADGKHARTTTEGRRCEPEKEPGDTHVEAPAEPGKVRYR
ncbi:hypothetical protein [Streptomyces sp. NPDC051286]|uniref:hypothetical protein n=1 Tax=Streptomyces sp. NPDC051286 TaxID=3365647 RepID=UPI0037A74294